MKSRRTGAFDDAIREGLKALGYYEPTIDFDLRPPPKRGVRC
jgi:translocation and assembly module TamA